MESSGGERRSSQKRNKIATTILFLNECNKNRTSCLFLFFTDFLVRTSSFLNANVFLSFFLISFQQTEIFFLVIIIKLARIYFLKLFLLFIFYFFVIVVFIFDMTMYDVVYNVESILFDLLISFSKKFEIYIQNFLLSLFLFLYPSFLSH